MKTLVLVFHPDMSASRANRPLAAKAETLGDDVTVRYMYDIYPDQKVDVAAEQAALEAADRVVLQFPMYWYSTPALLKQWLDDVLLYGWAYGSTGNALAGKELLVAVSTGGPGDAYNGEGSYGYTLTELLRPLQATANMTQMTYLEPFTTTGTLTITDEALDQKVEDYAATLTAEDLPVLDLHG
ncbi:flavodoxin family protein [Actinomyces viscosus]|uniref:General stress protein 14 n=1 Tax=Actinomyces viscosus TaxID=1656 RepID=A0A448PKU3_ACTVI|nr:NAD(P)H-dependent oxidoreductase [Actinomyces viscosus]TFH51142.1 flavodoxin family protein [Actinomyces viscosus]VEI15989.1 General stress protein 14 [Actinomyces viscosus]